ncbi:MAG: radical SAM family heme chaperone HemW [Micrococcaceae bacterium]
MSDSAFTPVITQACAKRKTATPLSLYIHIPYCKVRCGYCDFNTYTAEELGEGVNQKTYYQQVIEELHQYFKILNSHEKFHTIFFGGGTPTLLAAQQLCDIVTELKKFGINEECEITTEANPDTLSYEYLKTLKTGGFTRISIGMQSAVPHVLKTLDRTHNPHNVHQAVRWCKDLGLYVSLDLIYGTPGESLEDWKTSLKTAVALRPDHISAYALIIEEGTKMYRDIKHGLIAEPDPDDQASKYEIADNILHQSGYSWYEVSNWSTSKNTQCQHNINYWKNADWLGIGPGAHGHIDGVRWYNVKHPRAYTQRLAAGFPVHEFEVLTDEEKHEEHIMLAMRIKDGINVSEVPTEQLSKWQDNGYISSSRKEKLQLTQKGRLFADLLVKELLLN